MFDHSPSLYKPSESVIMSAEISPREAEFIAKHYAELRTQNISNRRIARHYDISIKQLKKALKSHKVAWIEDLRNVRS